MITWQKTSDRELSSVPPRYIIRSHQHSWYKSYEAIDTLVGGVFAARRGVAIGARQKMVEALQSIKNEIEEYDQKFG